MAYSQEQWDLAKEYFEAGLSLSEINLRTEISRPQISKKAKKEGWEKGNIKKQLISQAVGVEEKKKQIETQKETLTKTALKVHNELVDDEIRRRGLIFDATEKIVQASSKLLQKNSKQVVVKVKEYSKAGGSSESLDTIDQELDPQDLKNLAETVDKASITLGVNQRHANSQVTVNNTNAQQNNTVKSLDDFYED